MNRPSALLFDLNGTVIDDMRFHNVAWLELLGRHGVTLEEEEFFRKTAGMTNPAIFRLFFGETLSDAQVEALAAEKEAAYREAFREHLRPVAGLEDLLEAAGRAGVPTALATSAPQENIAFALEGLGLRFDTVVSAADITHSKPHPEIYLVGAERLGADPATCVAFEDAPVGIASAVAAGMRVYVVATVLPMEEAAAQPGVEGAIPDFVGMAERLFG